MIFVPTTDRVAGGTSRFPQTPSTVRFRGQALRRRQTRMTRLTTRDARARRRRRVRGKVSGTAERPRLAVFRSNVGIYAQLIDDLDGKTLASASSKGLPKSFKGTKTAQANEVGKRLAAAAKQAGIEAVVFDRAGYLYHGRVKALAEGAREGGLEF